MTSSTTTTAAAARVTDASPAVDASAPDATSAPSASETTPAPVESVDAGTEREPPNWEAEARRARAEAKRYRQERNTVQQERDTLRGRIDGVDRREVERIASDRLQDASDIWLTTDIAALRDEEGALDVDKVSEHLDAVLEQRSHWRKTTGPPPNFSSGVRQPIKRERTIGEALRTRSPAGRLYSRALAVDPQRSTR